MKNLVTFFKLLTVVSVVMLNSCQNENNEVIQETTAQKVSVADLKKEIVPASVQALPENVQIQLDESKKNLEKYVKDALQITGVTALGTLSTEKSVSIAQSLITDRESFISTGNILTPETVQVNKLGNLSSQELSTAQEGLKEIAQKEIKTNVNVLEISWNNKGESFTSLCFYNDSGIIWDNVLGGLVMMDARGTTEVSDNTQAKVLSKWYKQWWTADWIWGTKRGEMGYKITIYYSGSTVSNTDVEDWANISLGKAKSESKITKNSGTYGKCAFALGLCTPTGSLSFNSTNFTVSFSGLGSNIVHNGTKTLYP
ncbi:hypothetical protein [Chryseobacterium daecheongense]|uniref:Uncharacterized protein n=1 Tax=Chryseobacterium daecheongense TaxID=192389 RepID=A0A3N0W2Y4_9FLAO|nr:hypothetical protein [Chryseobacterium daecheongense]ROH99425.1 hypothetical protein EGI05_00575 [Chryseobacterium daecheongense]TDX95677.1 hypothetical protein BCF50_1460 [Chryseobacterium daecheongense]